MAQLLRSSLLDWDIESEFANFNNDLTVYPWDSLTKKICEELDDEAFQTLVFVSRERLGADSHAILRQENPGMAFFMALEKKYEEHVTEVLVNIFSHTNLHAQLGMVKIADKIREYQRIEQQYRAGKQRSPSNTSNLFGREQLLKDCLNCFLDNDTPGKVGVVLCGLSGMGKTSLAAEICYKLKYARPPWDIVTVNQRGKTVLTELCTDLVTGLTELLHPTSGTDGTTDHRGGVAGQPDLDCLRQHVKDLLKDLCNSDRGRSKLQSREVVIWLDDMDGQCHSGQLDDLCHFLQDITRLMAKQQGQGHSQTRLLITVARKLGREHEPVGWMNQRLGGQIREFEVPGLKPADTEAILRNIAGLKDEDLPEGVCDKLCHLCCGSPIAIRAAADLLRDGCKVREIIGYLKSDAPSMDQQLNKCITKALEQLDIDIGSKESKELLVQLTVFQSSEFDVDDVLAINQDSEGNEMIRYMKDVNKAKIAIRLIEFKARHLLEINTQFKKHMKETHVYSLHPLVVKYLQNTMKGSKELLAMEEEAKVRFLKYFYQKIQDLTRKQGRSPVRIKFLIEDKWVHIKRFFELLLYDEYCSTISVFDLTPASHPMSKKSVTVQHSRLWKLAASFLNMEKMKTFAHKQAIYAREKRNVCGYIYWTCVETENLIQREKMELAENNLKDMTNEIGECAGDTVKEIQLGTNVNDYEWPPVEVIPVYATYCYTRGKLHLESKQTELYDRALDYLNLAESLYEGYVPKVLRSKTGKERIHKREFKSDLARVQNLIGGVYFQKGDFEKSRTYYSRAYEIIGRELENDVKWHEDYTEYLSNIATTYHQEGLNTKDKSVRQQKFVEASKVYDQCIETDKTMKREMVFSHGTVLYKRAEIHYLQEEYEKAVSDMKKALKIMEHKFRPPNVHITLCFIQMASYLFKLGKEQKNKHKVDIGTKNLKDALEYFDYALSYIVDGGLPIDHNNHRTYRICKEKHLALLELLGKNTRKFEQKYRNFEMGHYDKTIQRNKLDDFDPEEFLQQAREEGAQLGPLIPCSDSDSSDSSDESSCSIVTRSSSSSNGQPSSIATLRQDSGIDLHRKESMEVADEVEYRRRSETVDGLFKFSNRLNPDQMPSYLASDPDSSCLKPRCDSVLQHRASYNVTEQMTVDSGMTSDFPSMPYREARVPSRELEQVEYRVKDKRGRDGPRPLVRDSGVGGSAEYDERSVISGQPFTTAHQDPDPRRQLMRQSSINEPFHFATSDNFSHFRTPHESSRFRPPHHDISDRSSIDFSDPPYVGRANAQRPMSLSVIQHTSQVPSRKRSFEVHQDNEQPGTSGVFAEPGTSGLSAEQRRLSWRTPTGSGSGGSADELRLSWRSAGSQDSVTAQFRSLKPFRHSQEEAVEEEEEPMTKKLRTSMEYAEGDKPT